MWKISEMNQQQVIKWVGNNIRDDTHQFDNFVDGFLCFEQTRFEMNLSLVETAFV